MHASEPAAEKYQKVCEDFPNLAILTKSDTPGKLQLTSGHATNGNNSLGVSIVNFALAGYLSSPPVVSFKIDINFATDGDKICLPIVEVLLCTAAGDLTRSKKQRDWTPRNNVFLPPFLTEAAILHKESDTGKLLKIFAHSITEWAKEGETASGEDSDNENDEDNEDRIEAEDKKTKKIGQAN